MARYDELVLDELEKAVENFEKGTAAELVFVLAHRSARYPDVPWKLGAVAALLALAVFLFAPVEFSPVYLLLDVAVAFALGWVLGRFVPGFACLLVSDGRRRLEVMRSCHAAFSQRGVSLTQDRTGLLVYVSWLEKEVELVWDVGIERAVPAPEWNQALQEFARAELLRDFPRRVDAALKPLAQVLAEHLPPVGDNPDEIPNRPVVLE